MCGKFYKNDASEKFFYSRKFYKNYALETTFPRLSVSNARSHWLDGAILCLTRNLFGSTTRLSFHFGDEVEHEGRNDLFRKFALAIYCAGFEFCVCMWRWLVHHLVEIEAKFSKVFSKFVFKPWTGGDIGGHPRMGFMNNSTKISNIQSGQHWFGVNEM